jgi:hypothetical protein
VNFTEQAPFESLQDLLENSPGVLLDQATLPVGEEPGPWTSASQVVTEPTTTGEGLHDNVRTGPVILLTESVAGNETTVTPAPSVTWSSNAQVPDIVKAPVDADCPEEGVQPVVKELSSSLKFAAEGGSSSHWQMKGEVPPVKVAVVDTKADWPLPIMAGETEIAGESRAGFTVTKSVGESAEEEG